MPIYTYRCENCGVQFERSQKFSDAPLKVCPECHKKALRKVYTPVGIVFKGSGFYVTDHRSSSSTSRPASSHTDKSASSEGKESSSTPSAETKTPVSEPVKSASSSEK